MSHITFYRKYRSKNFQEIIGQEHIIETLKNAISSDRLTHAYIFSGPRGTGKTSTARILAKSLNCRKGTSITPCLTCDLCTNIAKGQSVDVMEIDAASNTGVDNIRVLNEQVNFKPVECLYRMYIIDEAHMLSTGAFNALLKTLEEPPENTVFILATTEPQKIPITIHSRCQHLHFRKLTSEELCKQLKIISDAENIKISDKSILTIAHNASGCMRDAISLLDQIYAYKGNEISQEDVLLILGATNYDRLFDLADSIINSNTKQALTELNNLFAEGINIQQLLSHVTQIFKQILFTKLEVAYQSDFDSSQEAKMLKLASNVTVARLVSLFEDISKLEMDIRWFPNPELFLQVRILTILSSNENRAQEQENSTENIIAERPVIISKAEAPQAPKMQEIKKSELEVKPENVPAKPVESTQPDLNKNSGFTKEKWHGFINVLKEQHRAISVILEEAKIVRLEDKTIYLHIKYDIYKRKIKEDKYQAIINTALESVFSAKFRIDFEDNIDSSAINTDTGKEANDSVSKNNLISNEDNMQGKKVNQILEMFEGTLV
jgi:DNA polymerase III subunit gamma/tau